MNIMAKNIVIAHFMGLDNNADYVPATLLPSVKYDTFQGIFDLTELEFHLSWDWIIPVIEKCKERQVFGSQRLISNIEKRLVDLDILAVHSNVVDFINFYNQNKK